MFFTQVFLCNVICTLCSYVCVCKVWRTASVLRTSITMSKACGNWYCDRCVFGSVTTESSVSHTKTIIIVVNWETSARARALTALPLLKILCLVIYFMIKHLANILQLKNIAAYILQSLVSQTPSISALPISLS